MLEDIKVILTEGKVYGYEPYFEEDVVVGTIIDKVMYPRHGYFSPHKYGKQMKKYCEKNELTFNNK